MEKFEPACPWHIQIGELFIAPGMRVNSGTVWIGEVKSGSGREIKTEDLAPLLLKFYANQ